MSNEAKNLLECSPSLGNVGRITPDNTRGQRVELLRALGDNETGGLTTVALGIIGAEQLNVTVPLVALISFGQGGTSFSVEVDFAAGSMLSLPATFVEVSAFVDRNPITAAVPTFEGLSVNAALVRHNRAGGIPPTRSTPPFVLAPAASVVLLIPNFAAEWQLLSSAPAVLPAISFELLGGGAASDVIQSGFFVGPAPLKLPGHARAIQLTNTGGADAPLTTQFLLRI